MKIGDIVGNKEDGHYGTGEYSSFGFSIHSWVEYKGQLGLSKTIDAPASELLEYWTVIDSWEFPDDHMVHHYGGVVQYLSLEDSYQRLHQIQGAR